MHSLSSSNNQSWLSWFLRGVLILSFLILFARLFEVQIIKGSYFRALSQGNRIRHIPIPAPRGQIVARGGEVLVGNIETKKKISISQEGRVELVEVDDGTPDEEIVTDYVRFYPMQEQFAHASGYVGPLDPGQVNKIDPNCPEKGPRRADGIVGKNGLELTYDCLLSGVSGEELIEVDTKGRKLRSLGRRDPIPGRDLITTVDFNLQTELAQNMKDKKGAAVVTDIKGQILAFYSGPSFDPNLFVNKTDNRTISDLFLDKDLPFFNRVIGGTFHPGSVYKPVTAIAALEEGAIDAGFTYIDTGSIVVNDFSYANWYFTEYGRTEGEIDLPRAMARSTDTFFYKIGELVGPVNLAKWSQIFELDQKTGIDLPGEVAGLIPSPDWKKKVKRENWFLGNTYHMSIGQGDVAVSLLEINRYIASIGARGTICRPKFWQDRPESCKNIDIKGKTVDLVIEGMRQACAETGTAYTFFDFARTHGETEVACKTGTAEIFAGDDPHAWFTFFAPINNPEIVMTVLVEKGGQGSQVAGPIARDIADYYFQSLLSAGDTVR
jgi:penicillin-binding protein 2